MIVPVILSGGSGTRLWPVSRKAFPKQFHKLGNDNETLLQSTVGRLSGLFSKPLIVCNEEHRFIVAEQLRSIKLQHSSIILEPIGRNTAPAAAIAAFHILEKNQDAVMILLPSDHAIEDGDSFRDSINIAIETALAGKIVTFGIVPSRPETGYGYIRANVGKDGFGKIVSFKEKPDKETAEKFLNKGDYFWNSGMFVFKVKTFLDELLKFEPEVFEKAKEAYEKKVADSDFIRLDNQAFSNCPNISLDIAIMEQTTKGVMVPLATNWSDLGSWESIWLESNKTPQGNLIKGNVNIHNLKNSLIHSTRRFVSIIDLEDIILIDCDDALLLSKKGSSHKIKDILKNISLPRPKQLDFHKKVYRPWGYFISIDETSKYQVKLINLKAGSKISLQKHLKRSEHWIVIKGTANIVIGESEFILKENQSTYIPAGEVHRLENAQSTSLKIIEIQTGNYFGEDDIIRLDDIYGRHS